MDYEVYKVIDGISQQKNAGPAETSQKPMEPVVTAKEQATFDKFLEGIGKLKERVHFFKVLLIFSPEMKRMFKSAERAAILKKNYLN